MRKFDYWKEEKINKKVVLQCGGKREITDKLVARNTEEGEHFEKET